MNEFSHDARSEQPPSSDGAPGPGAASGGEFWRGHTPPPVGASFYPSPYLAPRPPRRRHRALRVTGGVLVVAASMAAGVGLGTTVLGSSGQGAPSAVAPQSTAGSGSNGSSGSSGGYGYGSGSSGGYGSSGSGGSGGVYGQPGSPDDTGATSALPRATATQEVGVVDVDTVLAYQGADAAGTGMVLTSSGEILTNNHVVDGATSVKVTVVATGATYTAKVVGTDPTQDVAVLQLQNASGLKTVQTDSSAANTAQKVTGVGNAGGVGGTPSAAAGTVTATGTTITATDQGGSNPETLHGMIQDDADIQAGDSGGPLYNTSGQVVGMDTAAQATRTEGTTTGYAIPIGTALKVAGQIESGTTSSTVHQGYPAFLGVSLPSDQTASAAGAVVQQAIPDTPAAQAGITAGDMITAIGAHQITSAPEVAAALATDRPGQHVHVTWTDQEGQSHTATVTLATGPAN
ncbi:S1C family serine protease [Leekyejoonella antrihumi]|uniref:PDZ domain-containing protein n=1 Tax=Leekyejoonella antrihumi TaxID=1660198 RepID=A0A563DV13_9MICO|nr:trypsin-like peptidase domain-containing protein [Leekyejoonella antrihumi]TWP33752.1 PDZ domain-containing protein [Leekyejoonella antrihumi]